MSRHEKHCTANPSRVCGMCGNEGIDGFIEALGVGDTEGVNRLTEVAHRCPACILAGIRQSRVQRGPSGDEESFDFGFSVPWDYELAKREFWDRKNEDELKNDYYYGRG